MTDIPLEKLALSYKLGPSIINSLVAKLVLLIEASHNKGRIHRNLRSEHLILSQGQLKFTRVKREPLAKSPKRTRLLGPPDYLAPELIARHEAGYISDWWAVGVITYELYCQKMPFSTGRSGDEPRHLVYQRISNGEYHHHEMKHIPEHAQSFIKALLEIDEERRLGANGAEQVKAHPFFNYIVWEDLERKEIHLCEKPLFESPAKELVAL